MRTRRRTLPRVRQAIVRWNRERDLVIDGRPFLEIVIEEIARQGVTRFLVLDSSDGTRTRTLTAKLADALGLELTVEVVSGVDPSDGLRMLGAIGDRLADPFYFIDGDTWSEVPLAALVRAASEKPDALGVVAVSRTATDVDDAVRGLLDGADSRSTATGIGLFRLALFDAAPSLDATGLDALVARGSFMALASDAYVLDLRRDFDRERAEIEIPQRRRRPALFLDRDGVINSDDGYIGSVDRFAWIDGAREAIHRANRLGYYVFVVTNQSGIARGYFTEEDYRSVKDHVRAGLAEIGAHIDDERYCPFHEDGVVDAYRRESDLRKPHPGMLVELMRRWPVDLSRSLMVGDKESDLAAATAAGIRGHLFSGGNLDAFLEPLLVEVPR